jgi:diadenosine tetraphosphate (Ap4A) HIT family hydrolase
MPVGQTAGCAYCAVVTSTDEPAGGWVYRDEHWAVAHGPAEKTAPGGLLIRSARHFVDFAEMSGAETTSFGQLVARLDAAIRATVDAERVHLVSTRDRVQHFHAWLYPRAADVALRGTDFLAAPQEGSPVDVERAVAAIRTWLAGAAVAAA